MKEFSFIKFYLCLKILMSTALLNLDSFADPLQEFSKSSQKFWRKNVCQISLSRWLFRKNNNAITVMIKTMLSKLKMNLYIAPTETSFCKLSKNYQSYANHVARIIDQHFAGNGRQTTIRVYFQSLFFRILDFFLISDILNIR